MAIRFASRLAFHTVPAPMKHAPDEPSGGASGSTVADVDAYALPEQLGCSDMAGAWGRVGLTWGKSLTKDVGKIWCRNAGCTLQEHTFGWSPALQLLQHPVDLIDCESAAVGISSSTGAAWNSTARSNDAKCVPEIQPPQRARSAVKAHSRLVRTWVVLLELRLI